MPGARTVWRGNSGICMLASAYADPGNSRAAGTRRLVSGGWRCDGEPVGPCASPRRGSVGAALGRATVVRGAEAGAAAAAGDRVRVVDREPRAHEGVDVVDLAAGDERDAVLHGELDEVADLVRQQLGKTAEEMPLACVLQGGTWTAGRQLAAEKRADGGPPIQLISDGTVF